MLNRLSRFNIYLLAALLLSAVWGCHSSPTKEGKAKKRTVYSSLRLHMECRPDGTDRSLPVPVFRASPVLVNVEKNPFLNESDVDRASITEEPGGFALHIEFGRDGKMLLEQYSANNLGRRIAIFSQFAHPTNDNLSLGRWLAAPRIDHRITNGALTFTPDASREEADQVVRGLNNVVGKRDSNWR